MKSLVMLSAVLLGMAVGQARAEIVYNELVHSYEKSAEGRSAILDNYLTGVYEGINAANLAYYMQSRTHLFCKPGNLELNPKDLRNLIREAHETFDSNNDIPVSYLLFIGLKQTFPCL